MKVGIEKNKHGFTIVELLVVVVVIAILAAIVVVAYRGTLKNTYNAQVIAGVKIYYDAIQTYYIQHHKYPTTSKEENGDHIAMTCLGVGYKSSTCGTVTGTTIYEDADFNQTMTTFLKSKTGPIAAQIVPVQGESYVGAVYGLDDTSADHNDVDAYYGRVIEYALHGTNQDCGVSEAYQYNTAGGGTACEIFLERAYDD